MATKFSPCKGSYVLNQFPSNVMFGMNGFQVSASGVIQGHHGPLVGKGGDIVLVLSVCPSTLISFHSGLEHKPYIYQWISI